MARRDGAFYHRIAGSYASARPGYPDSLFEYLGARTPARLLAWDCGTGNGQAARSLAALFDQVIATDHEPEQIRLTTPAANVVYRVGEAEESGLPDASADLVTVAQAVHWFDLDRFYGEVRRVLRPGGVIAVWCYRLPRVSAAIDEIVTGLYHAPRLQPLWPAERAFVDAGYTSLAFPFTEFDAPRFEAVERWDYSRFAEYLNTWQAVADAGQIPEAESEVRRTLGQIGLVWGGAVREVRWDLYLRVGTHHA